LIRSREWNAPAVSLVSGVIISDNWICIYLEYREYSCRIEWYIIFYYSHNYIVGIV
jgi:hypothetical protein